MSLIEIFNNTPHEKWIKVGSGTTRNVWAVPGAPGVVFKRPHGMSEACFNCSEAALWHAIRFDEERASWCAPVLECLPGGMILAMVRTRTLYESEVRLKDELLPTWIGDKIHPNFGTINGQIVCHDYAHHSVKGVASYRDFK